jgi:hypothetical protein
VVLCNTRIKEKLMSDTTWKPLALFVSLTSCSLQGGTGPAIPYRRQGGRVRRGVLKKFYGVYYCYVILVCNFAILCICSLCSIPNKLITHPGVVLQSKHTNKCLPPPTGGNLRLQFCSEAYKGKFRWIVVYNGPSQSISREEFVKYSSNVHPLHPPSFCDFSCAPTPQLILLFAQIIPQMICLLWAREQEQRELHTKSLSMARH